MKIVKDTIRRITISEVPRLDPIRVTLEDIGPRQGRINIECYGASWACYWGGMGDKTIAEFFTSCDEHYIAKNLSKIDSMVFDPDHLKETLKREVIDERRKRLLHADEARHRFDAIEALNLPEHEEQLWSISKELDEIMGEEWWHRLPKKPNPDYEYLCRIILAVQSALKQSQGAISSPVVCNEGKVEQLKKAAMDLLGTIELHTDCMDGHIKRESIDDWMDKLEAAIADVNPITATGVPA